MYWPPARRLGLVMSLPELPKRSSRVWLARLLFQQTFIHDARYLCTRLRTDGTKATSGGKQVGKSTDKPEIVLEFFYSRQQENEELFILKTMMASYGWKWLT